MNGLIYLVELICIHKRDADRFGKAGLQTDDQTVTVVQIEKPEDAKLADWFDHNNNSLFNIRQAICLGIRQIPTDNSIREVTRGRAVLDPTGLLPTESRTVLTRVPKGRLSHRRRPVPINRQRSIRITGQ